MRWQRIVKELILALLLIVWIIICNFLSSEYPISSILLLGVIFPVGALLLHAYLFWKVPPPKGRTKWFVIAALGMAAMPLGGLLGPVGLILLPVGLLIWAFGVWRTWRAVGHASSCDKEALEVRAPETPKSFLKKCVRKV